MMEGIREGMVEFCFQHTAGHGLSNGRFGSTYSLHCYVEFHSYHAPMGSRHLASHWISRSRMHGSRSPILSLPSFEIHLQQCCLGGADKLSMPPTR